MDILDVLKFATPTKVDWNATRSQIIQLSSFGDGNQVYVERILKEARHFVRKYSPGTAYRLVQEHNHNH